jgi:hypothetical protein
VWGIEESSLCGRWIILIHKHICTIFICSC